MDLLKELNDENPPSPYPSELTPCIYIGPATEEHIRTSEIKAVMVFGPAAPIKDVPVLRPRSLEEALRGIWEHVAAEKRILVVESESAVPPLAMYFLRRLYILSPKDACDAGPITSQVMRFIKRARPSIGISAAGLQSVFEYEKKLAEAAKAAA